MIRLNPNINIEDYLDNWSKNKIVTIHNLLIDEDGNRFNKYLLNLPEKEWNISIHLYDDKILKKELNLLIKLMILDYLVIVFGAIMKILK